MEEIRIKVDREVSRAEAEDEARKKLPADAVLLAWYDRVNRTGSPQGAASERYFDDYSRNRGAKAKVVVNDRFALFFTPLPSRG